MPPPLIQIKPPAAQQRFERSISAAPVEPRAKTIGKRLHERRPTMTEIEIRVAAIELVLTKVGAMADQAILDQAAETIHASLIGASPDERAVLQRALTLIGMAQDRL
jgi:hypothetical protein